MNSGVDINGRCYFNCFAIKFHFSVISKQKSKGQCILNTIIVNPLAYYVSSNIVINYKKNK